MGFDDRPVVAVTNHDLVTALQGYPVVVSDRDGREVLLRLMTVDEAMRTNRDAISTLAATIRAAGDTDWEGPEPMSREQAGRLVRPLR